MSHSSRISVNEVVECLFKSGEMAYKTGRFAEAGDYFGRTVATYKRSIGTTQYIDSYYVAQAQFMLGELIFGRL